MVSLKLAFVNAQPIPLSPEDLYTAPMGGSEKALLHLAKELTLLGHSVTIICNLSQGKLSDTYSFSENGKIYSYKLLSLSEYEKIIKNKYYDILVYFRLLTPLAYGSPKCGASVYVTHDMPNNHIIENLTGGIWGIDKVLFISEFQRKEFIKALSSQIPEFSHFTYVTRNGIDYNFIQKSINKNQNTKLNFSKFFMFMSRLERGALTAVDILNLYNYRYTEDPMFSLFITTYQFHKNFYKFNPDFLKEMSNSLQQMSEKVPSIIYNSDGLAPDSLYKHIHESSAIIYPTSFYETFCISALESLACGAPFICSDIGALSEVLPKDYPGIVSTSLSSDEFANTFLDKMYYAVNNRNEFSEIGKAHASQDKWKWETIAKEWSSLFISLLASNNCLNTGDIGEIRSTSPRKEPTIGLAMIVKNEGDNIRGALRSVLDNIKIDKIQILDTGSTDDTESISTNFLKSQEIPFTYLKKEYQQVETFDENNPNPPFYFDLARNASCEGLDTDWVLWIDADERFTPLRPRPIQDFLTTNYFNGYGIRQINFSCDSQSATNEMASQTPIRLFKNNPLYIPLVSTPIRLCTFIGVIHEHVEFGPNIPVTPVTNLSNYSLAHFGYLGEKSRRQKAIVRNLNLLVRDRKVYPFRVMGVALMIRDLFHMFNWELEKGKFNKDYLRRIYEIYQEAFINQPFKREWGAAFGESSSYYQKVLQICKENNVKFDGMDDIVCIHHSFIISEEPKSVRAEPQWISSFKEYELPSSRIKKEADEAIKNTLFL